MAKQRGILGNVSGLFGSNSNEDFLRDARLYAEYFNRYAKYYNQDGIKRKIHPITIVAHLSQINQELQLQIDSYQKIFDELKARLDDDLKKIEEDSSNQAYRIGQMIPSIWQTQFGLIGYTGNSLFGEKTIPELLEEYRKTAKKGLSSDPARLRFAEKQKHEADKLYLQKSSLEDFIHHVLLMDYPDEIESYDLDSEKSIEKAGKNLRERGRPFDGSIPQDKILKVVIELTNKGRRNEKGYGRFWHHSGRYQGKPNKNQIAKEIRESGIVDDNVDDSTILRRINLALEHMS